jgi:hypothetical protein
VFSRRVPHFGSVSAGLPDNHLQVREGDTAEAIKAIVGLDGLGAQHAGTPRVLFEGRYSSAGNVRQYDVSRDGSHFLMIRQMDRLPLKPTQMILVQNWFEELKRRVPTK